jgi:hypothetical protein
MSALLRYISEVSHTIGKQTRWRANGCVRPPIYTSTCSSDTKSRIQNTEDFFGTSLISLVVHGQARDSSKVSVSISLVGCILLNDSKVSASLPHACGAVNVSVHLIFTAYHNHGRDHLCCRPPVAQVQYQPKHNDTLLLLELCATIHSWVTEHAYLGLRQSPPSAKT